MRRGRRVLAGLILVVVAAFLLAAPFAFKPYGIYVTIWRRQADGKWKFVYDSATILSAPALLEE